MPCKCQGALFSPALGFSEQVFCYFSKHSAGMAPATGEAGCSCIIPGKDLCVLLSAVTGGKRRCQKVVVSWSNRAESYAFISCPPTHLCAHMRGRNKFWFGQKICKQAGPQRVCPWYQKTRTRGDVFLSPCFPELLGQLILICLCPCFHGDNSPPHAAPLEVTMANEVVQGGWRSAYHWVAWSLQFS